MNTNRKNFKIKLIASVLAAALIVSFVIVYFLVIKPPAATKIFDACIFKFF